ncbi:MAG: hypothetical protein ABI678_05600 [Kofleriaceae bacterium]
MECIGRGCLWLLLFCAACSGGGGGSGDDDDAPLAHCGDGNVDGNEQCDDGNEVAGDGCTLCMLDAERKASIDASWSLRTAANTDADCPSGFETAAVTAQPVDDQGAPNGTPTVEKFSCADKMATTMPLKAQAYLATVAIQNASGSSVFATSLPMMVDLSDATNKPLDTEFLTDGGRFQLAWKLVKMSNNAPVQCTDVDTMAKVRVLITNMDTSISKNAQFACSAGMALTPAVVAGTYTVSVAVLNNVFANQGQAADLTGQLIVAPDGLTDLAIVTIPVAAL